MPIVEGSGVPIHYEMSGTGDPVLLLHGLGSSVADWSAQMPVLAPRFRAVAVDVRGHGASGKPPGPYRMADFAADAKAALVAAGATGPAHVIGISMGGMIALQLALEEPGLVRSLVILNSGPELRPRNLKERWQILQRRVFTRLLSQRTLGRIIAGRLFPKPEQASLRAGMEERWAANDKTAYRATLGAILRWSVAARLPDIRQPTLVVSGDRDYTTVDSKRSWAARMPNARVTVLADSGHASSIDQPEAFNRMVMEFFDSQA